eukprot:TRINITY_DN6919_c0_g1_i5.p1 TRINITY_DN6919_c0_g1~~TRINITY_DN6919_c0_g1_i5.p1  ORF type:complete len:768 (-),score=205.58 TRINITY_DN6919_c0_g1_i5:23-2326(-)
MGRAKPFSGKKKKEQLQAKHEKKRNQLEKEKHQDGWGGWEKDARVVAKPAPAMEKDVALIPRTTTTISGARGGSRLATIFARESDEEIALRKMDAHRPLDTSIRSRPLESMLDTFDEGVSSIEIPKRPKWNYTLGPAELTRREEAAFKTWLRALRKPEWEGRLNYYEHNLEVWRQLWRVCERSDILLIITDARYPLFHFPLALYHYVVNDMHKPIILVLNKVDLVSPEVVDLWEQWFLSRFPTMRVVKFSSFKGMREEGPSDTDKRRRSAKGKKKYEDAGGKSALLEAIRSFQIEKEGQIVHIADHAAADDDGRDTEGAEASGGDDDSDKDEENDEEDGEVKDENDDEFEDDDDDDEDYIDDERASTDQGSGVRVYSELDSADYQSSLGQGEDSQEGDDEDRDDGEKNNDDEDNGEDVQADGDDSVGHHPVCERDPGRICVGTIGHPNVGKSSLINGLVGRKVVSTSRTPGHTKHFQTINLAHNVVLVDCPGLVFPALDRPKAMQVLCGLFPIAQVREPFSAIRYLAERVPIERVYGVRPEDGTQWTPFSLCEAVALKKGFLLAKSGRPDAHRAGLQILKDCVDGNIVISWPPPETDPAAFPPSSSSSSTTTPSTSVPTQATMSVDGIDPSPSSTDQKTESGDDSSDEDSNEKQRSKRDKKRIQKQQQKYKLQHNEEEDGDSVDYDEMRTFLEQSQDAGAARRAPRPSRQPNDTHSRSPHAQAPPAPSHPQQQGKGKKGRAGSAKATEYAEKLAEKQSRGKTSAPQK